MSIVIFVQGVVVAGYLMAACLLFLKPRWAGITAVILASLACSLHLLIIYRRWQEIGQLPIVTRYEDMTVDALAIAALYLILQWFKPEIRLAGRYALPIAAFAVGAALWYNLGSVPFSPALRTNWLLIHSQLNSLAVGLATVSAAVLLLPGRTVLAGSLMAWTFFLWSAMTAAGSYWASIAWGRYWGWDPIESWSLVTVLAYAFVLHLRFKPAWRRGYRVYIGLLPYLILLFTTYGLLMIRGSIHSQYLFN
ncbi:MAG: cytochrome c biogenesis protein CcsA [Candidatus Polarisedimenticolaceae bacterium]|nr:cytochrome c biogenesis protein CcsA [Candidatus Polarisedimenticolaceae bacterium]